ncbi:hypothetical protein N7491_005826 [Penicillium cf. griseofulvum]|uniref:Uncharacterized protein n=1 Tax=Penicillium cf. griseofulvum TaxID=2972120 RepID=A0A9W9J8A3_9EURO|nr:hypothetical protein N7472_008510 [Penicillium cf. griseofulvum]KAJ5435231.1 hypothetical protein N7491_005826 [Penicillium cf. griseofulvum]KAJ5453064.1 hypothetical protein N7445_001247 [Penicillium cf. griseofulvum]
MADPDMDEFAQTRGADDLFDDEIIPISTEQQQAHTEIATPKPEPEPEPQETHVPEKPAPEQPSARGETPQRGRGERGRRRRGKGRGGREEQKRSESSPRKKTANVPAADARGASASKPEKPAEPKEQTGPVEEGNGEDVTANGADAQRVPAVRGDRSATGGLRKPKLTEEELSKRIATAKENAVKKAAAHARAEADQASFMEREQEAAKKRREELAHRRVMDSEREKNRQRKLKAQTGREWDSQKREEDYDPRGGGSQFRRGMHGGVSGAVRRDFEETRSENTDHSGGNRGRGRGRGGRDRGSPRSPRAPQGDRPRKGLSDSIYATPTPAAPGLDDKNAFPALPEGPKTETKPVPKAETKPKVETKVDAKAAASSKSQTAMDKLDSTFSPITGTWADQFDDE